MTENEENIEDNVGGGEAEAVVEQPVIQQWSIVPDNEPTHLPTENVFKVVPEVEEKIAEMPEAIVEEVIETPAVEEVIDQPNVEQEQIDEAKVLEFLKKEKGFKGENLDDFKPTEQIELDAEVKAYLQYKKDTNRSYADWQETQKDYSQEPKDKVLLMNLKLDNPTLNDKQIDRLYNREYSFDLEFDDEDTITDKEINIERDYQKGLAKLEFQKEQYKAVRGSDETVPQEYKEAKTLVDNWNKQQEESKIAFEQNRQDFQSKTDDVFNPNFEGFEINVGEQKFKVKPENIESAKNTLSDLSNFDKKFFDETGKLKDPEGYYKALHFAMNPDKMAEHFVNIGKALQVEDDERESKNIQVQGQSSRNAPLINSGKKWTVEN